MIIVYGLLGVVLGVVAVVVGLVRTRRLRREGADVRSARWLVVAGVALVVVLGGLPVWLLLAVA